MEQRKVLEVSGKEGREDETVAWESEGVPDEREGVPDVGEGCMGG